MSFLTFAWCAVLSHGWCCMWNQWNELDGWRVHAVGKYLHCRENSQRIPVLCRPSTTSKAAWRQLPASDKSCWEQGMASLFTCCLQMKQCVSLWLFRESLVECLTETNTKFCWILDYDGAVCIGRVKQVNLPAKHRHLSSYFSMNFLRSVCPP